MDCCHQRVQLDDCMPGRQHRCQLEVQALLPAGSAAVPAAAKPAAARRDSVKTAAAEAAAKAAAARPAAARRGSVKPAAAEARGSYPHFAKATGSKRKWAPPKKAAPVGQLPLLKHR